MMRQLTLKLPFISSTFYYTSDNEHPNMINHNWACSLYKTINIYVVLIGTVQL